MPIGINKYIQAYILYNICQNKMQHRKVKWASSQLRKGRDRMQVGKKNALKKSFKSPNIL